MTNGLITIFIIINSALLIILIILWLKYQQKQNNLENLFKQVDNLFFQLETKLSQEGGQNRQEYQRAFKELREEIHHIIGQFSDSILKKMVNISDFQSQQFEQIRRTVEDKLSKIQEDNNLKLEQMRSTVDEKLHTTLEKRLSEAFNFVSDRLEKVHQGLGDMQKLAVGVGDLKKVLANVRTRGTLGEIQLKNQLEQILNRQQFAENVKTKKDSNALVEFAIKLPGKEIDQEVVWLPIDSKYPLENYELLLNAYETGEKPAIAEAGKKLVSDIKQFAKDISGKYLDPPGTTDFGLMYLPIEGLYAEVLRFPGLFEYLQRECHIIPVGPTTLGAILSSLQMGFRTLAIEKRTGEIWGFLAAIRSQFGKFGELLDRTQKKLHEASQSIEDASRKSKYIEGKLNRVEEIPDNPEKPILDISQK